MRVLLRTVVTAAVLVTPAAAPAGEKDVETRLPAKAEDIQVAGGGKYLVFKLRNTRGLTVYDAVNQKLTAIDLPDDDIVYAAGGNVAVVFLKEKGEIRSIDLATGKVIKSKEFADNPNITTIVMGHSRDDLALVRKGRNPRTGVTDPDLVVDVAELRMTPTKAQPQQFPGGGGRPFDQTGGQLRANGDMSRLVEWPGVTQIPNGFGLITRTADGGMSYTVNYGSAGPVIPGDDGKVYAGFGVTMEPDPNYNPNFGGTPFKMSSPIKGQSLVPALGGQFYLGVSREGGLKLYQAKQTDALCPLDEAPGWEPLKKPDPNLGGVPHIARPDGRGIGFDDYGPGSLMDGKTPFTLDRRIVLAPAHGHILFVPMANDRIIQRKFDLKATLDQTGEDYLLVTSVPPLRGKGGAAWEYPLKAVAKDGPVKVELTRAPDGMVVGKDDKITWTPPKGVIGRAPVEVKITDAKDRATRQVFEVSFD